MLRWFNKRGQNTAEFAILIGVVVAAAIAMQVFVRRGLQARVKDAVDYSRVQDETTSQFFNTPQYEPYYSDTATQTTQIGSSTETMEVGGALGRTQNQTVSRTGYTATGNWSDYTE